MYGLSPSVLEADAPDVRSVLELACAGDAEAYGEVYRAYSTRLLRQAMTLCGNVAQAEELAQDTLVEAWKCLGRYNGRCDFFTWLCAILLHRYRKSVRARRRLPAFGLGSQEADALRHAVEELSDHSPLPDEAAERHEQAALVWQCLKALPFKQQQVIYLRFYVADSLGGIAAALGCSVGTVKSRLFHALDRLRGMKALGTQFMNLKTKG